MTMKRCRWTSTRSSSCAPWIPPAPDAARGLYVTFTPLEGLSETVLEYLPGGELPQGPQTGEKHVTLVGWDDVPHLSEASKASLRASIPPYQLDARTRGIPMLGAGAIYPVEEALWLVDDFPIPPHWRQAYGLDVGWQRT